MYTKEVFMEKRRLKLALSIVSLMVVITLIATGVALSLISYKYSWNNRVDLEYVPQEAKLTIEGSAGDSSFVANADNGQFDNGFWEIPNADTTFTQNNKKITISFKFTNKCTSKLKVTISGIHYDSKKRFETTVLDGSNFPISVNRQPDGTGECQITLESYQSVSIVNLCYELKEQTVKITGDANDKQNLIIKVDEAI
jgi:FlaG/FlaF family flagellin (archaellin)